MKGKTNVSKRRYKFKMSLSMIRKSQLRLLLTGALLAAATVYVVFGLLQVTDDSSNEVSRTGIRVLRYLDPPSSDYLKLKDQLIDANLKPQVHCQRYAKFGGQYFINFTQLEGAKFFCLDPEYNLITINDCLVYDFGINNDFSLARAMEEFGCDIYCFDMSMNKSQMDVSPHIHFFPYGLSNQTEVKNGQTFHSLETVVKMMGHEDRTINILKMDIENDEWKVLTQQFNNKDSVLLNQVEYVSMEVHLGYMEKEENVRMYYDYFLQMQDHGFYLVHGEQNAACGITNFTDGIKFHNCQEVVWFKI